MYRVFWLDTALNELTMLWMNADSEMREAIVEASHNVDRRLRSDPYGESESRPNGKRIRFVHPLVVLYEVEDDRTVYVGHVRSMARRNRQ